MSDVAEVRIERRVEPRTGVAVAGAGVVVAVLGAIGLAADQTGGVEDPNRVPGLLISVVLVGGGVALVRWARTGPLALAGSVAALVGVPAFMVVATLDDDLPGFAFAATLAVSAIAWALLHVVCDRRLLFLTGFLVAVPLFVMEVVEEISNIPEVIGYGLTSAFFGSGEAFEEYEAYATGPYVDEDGDGYDDVTYMSEEDHEAYVEGFGSFDELDRDEPPDVPDATVLGAIALVFSIVYLASGRVLSGRGAFGAATPATVVGGVLAAVGIALLADDLGDGGTGIVLVIAGACLVKVGVEAGRRFTTWWGALLLGIGVSVLLAEVLGDDVDSTVASLTAVVVGSAVVLAGKVLGDVLDEAPEEGLELLPVVVLADEDGPFEVVVEDDE